MNTKQRETHEIEHFTKIPHIWWGLKTIAGKKRYQNKYKTFLIKCNVQNDSKILEVGCGNGEFTKWLANIKTKGVHITAIDITPGLIDMAKKLVKSQNVRFKTDNLHNLSFKEGEFDIVCGISILHHVDLSKSLSEIIRVLKPGGEIFFTEPNYINPLIYFGLHIPYLRTKMEFSPDETAFKRWKLQEELKKAGFKKIVISNYDFLSPNTPRSFISIVENIGSFAEKIPFIKEISGSLIIYARK